MVSYFSPLKCILITLLLMVSASGYAVEIRATLDSAEVTEGDTVKLTVTVDEQADNKTPDFTVLNKNFEVISTFRAERKNIINGRFESYTTWVLTLLPKRSGYLAVPAIEYGNLASKPLKVHVAKRSSKPGNDQYLFLDASVDKQQAYVQEQIIYTVRIFKSGVDIYDPSYQPPTLDDAVMEQLGDQRNYQTTVNGRIYEVFEFRYALFPQKSGSLTVPPAQLNATVFRGRSRGFTFDPLNGKQVRRSTPSLEITVKPKPASCPADKPWVPARSLQLGETWSPDTDTMKLGEPLTRTITIQAEGVLPTILPQVPQLQPDGIKVYPEQADTSNTEGDHGIVATRTESQALVATATGDITLPPLEITWWDIEAGAVKVTSLPPRTLEVTGTSTQPLTDATAGLNPGATTGNDNPDSGLSADGSLNRTWQWLALAFLVAWLITLGILVWALQRRGRQTEPAAEDAANQPFTSTRLRAARKALQMACDQDDPKAARTAVIELFRQHYRDANIRNLQGIGERSESEQLQAALRQLDAHLYQPQSPTRWQPDSLLTAVDNELKKQSRQTSSGALEPLYPVA